MIRNIRNGIIVLVRETQLQYRLQFIGARKFEIQEKFRIVGSKWPRDGEKSFVVTGEYFDGWVVKASDGFEFGAYFQINFNKLQKLNK